MLNPILGHATGDTSLVSDMISPSHAPKVISDVQSASDVKKCDSALCHTCQLRDGIEFINVNNYG